MTKGIIRKGQGIGSDILGTGNILPAAIGKQIMNKTFGNMKSIRNGNTFSEPEWKWKRPWQGALYGNGYIGQAHGTGAFIDAEVGSLQQVSQNSQN